MTSNEIMEKHKSIAVKSLVKLYGGSSTTYPVACACVGMLCCNTSCSTWWTFFLETFSAGDIKKMVNMYMIATDKE